MAYPPRRMSEWVTGFALALAYRLMNEIWSNSVVVAGFYGGEILTYFTLLGGHFACVCVSAPLQCLSLAAGGQQPG